MKKRLSKLASVTLATALTLGAIACATNGSSDSGPGGSTGGVKQEFQTSNDFFAMSAASGVSFLNTASSNGSERLARRMKKVLSDQPIADQGAGATDVNDQTSGKTELVRPAEYTDETVAELKNTLVMFDSIVGGGVSSKVENCTETDGEYATYAYKMTVTFGGETAVMYYNELSSKTETEVDEDGEESETKTELGGVLLSGENVYEVTGTREEEISADEKEFELELIVKKSQSTYVKFTYGTENEAGESETEYEFEIYENGKKIQETEISIEVENGKTEFEFEFKNGGKGNGVEYKIVKRTENKFDIRREQNGKKSYVLAEKIDQGYKFTYSNGFSETVE